MSGHRRTYAQLLAAVYRYRFLLLAVAVAGTGAVLIAFPAALGPTGIAEHFGVALFAAGTVGLAVDFYTRQQFRVLLRQEVRDAVDTSSFGHTLNEMLTRGSLDGDLRELGVRRIYRDRNAIDFGKLIQGAEAGSEVRLLGVCLAGFTDRRTQGLIENRLRDNCRVRFLILDPESEAVRIRAAEEGRTYEDIRKDIKGADEIHGNFVINRVPVERRNQITLGHYDAAPGYFMFSTQSTMIVGFYLRTGLGELFPHLELDIKEGGIYTSFSRHFESLWNARLEARNEPVRTLEETPAA